MNDNKGNSSGIYIIVMTAFFIGCFLLLIIFGTNIYRHIAGRQSGNNDQRAVLSYLLTASKMNEAEISVLSDPAAGQLLVIEDPGTGYGNRIYINDGYLVEDYGRVDGALMPDYATNIGKTDIFEMTRINSSLIKIRTDQGNVFIHAEEAGDSK